MKYFNGYTLQEVTEAEVKSLPASSGTKIVVLSDSFNLETLKREVTAVKVYSHITGECHCYKCETRTIFSIARIIKMTWSNVWFGAVPYLSAMAGIESVSDKYGADSGASVVLYFLSNAAQYKGTVAKHVKGELKYYTGLK